ncbi:hypothetical protein ID858_18465, partial [Xenorhabdus sp. DI]
IAIADIAVLHHPPGVLALGNLFHRAVGIDRQVPAQVAVGIVAKLLLMGAIAVKQGMQDLVVGIIAVAGLP